MAAFGASSASVLGARALTGAGISVTIGEASSYVNTGKLMTLTQTAEAAGLGAITGVVLGGKGASLEQTVPDAIRYTALKVGSTTLTWGGFTAAISAGAGAVDPALWNGTSNGSQGTQQSAQSVSRSQQLGKTQQPGSPYTIANIPSFLSFVGKSTLSGMSFGAEYGGVFYAGGAALGSAVETISPAAYDFARANPIVAKIGMSGVSGGGVAAYGLATGQPARVVVAESAVAAAIPLALGASDFITGRNVISDFKILSINEQGPTSEATTVSLDVNGQDAGTGSTTMQAGEGKSVFQFRTGRSIFSQQYYGTSVSTTAAAADAGLGLQTGLEVNVFNSKGTLVGSTVVPGQAGITGELPGDSELIRGANGVVQGRSITNYDFNNQGAPKYIRFLSGSADILDLRLSTDNLPTLRNGIYGNGATPSVTDISMNAETYGEAEVSNVKLNGQSAEMAKGVAYNSKISGPIRFTALTYTPASDTFGPDMESPGGETRAIGPRISAISGASSDMLSALSMQHFGILSSSPLLPGTAYISSGFFGTVSGATLVNSPSSSGSVSGSTGTTNVAVDLGNGEVGFQKQTFATSEEQSVVTKPAETTTTTQQSITGMDPLITGSFTSVTSLPSISFDYSTTGVSRVKPVTGIPIVTTNTTNSRYANITKTKEQSYQKNTHRLSAGFGELGAVTNIQNSRSSLIGGAVQSNAVGSRLSSKQKTEERTLQKTLSISSVGIGLNIPNIGSTDFLYDPHYQLRNNYQKKATVPKRNPIAFSYVSDLMHASLNIHGPQTKIGISRPIPIKRRKR